MALQSNHFPETLDTPDDAGRFDVALLAAVRNAIEGVLLVHGFERCNAAAIATMTAGCCESNLCRVLSEPADAPVATVDDEEPAPF